MRRNYDFSQQLGRGSFGVVYKVKSKTDGCWYVCKQIQLQSMNKKAREEANQEVTLLRKVSSGSDYIVQYVESFLDGDSLHIIMEFCEHGDLSRYIKAQAGQNIVESTVWKFLIQIGLGLRWLHMNRILHRDIKTLNVFLTSANDVRLGDLGVARVLSHNTNFASTFVGTPYYLSPELCEEKPYNEKSDVWAYGCVVYEMCSLKHPFDARNHAALLVKILRGQYSPVPAVYSSELHDIIDECMRRDYVQRPTLSQLLDSKIVQVWSERLGISLDGSTEKPAVVKSRAAAKTTAQPQRVARGTRAAPKRAQTSVVGGVVPARRSEPVRTRGGAARGRARGAEETPVKTQVICAPPSTHVVAQQVVNRAPVGRGAGKPPLAVPSSSPMTRKDPIAEERRREAARREVANLPDRPDRVPSKERRNVTSVQEFMQMEAESASTTMGSLTQPSLDRLSSTDSTMLSPVVVRSPSPRNTTLTAGQVLQQAADLVRSQVLQQVSDLEITAVPEQHAWANQEEATVLPRPPRPPVAYEEEHLPPIAGVHLQEHPVAAQVYVSAVPDHLPPITPIRLHDTTNEAPSAPQLRVLRHLDESQHPLDCSVFGETLGTDDRWEDSLAYSVDNGTFSYSQSLARRASDDDNPMETFVRWDVTGTGTQNDSRLDDELGDVIDDNDDELLGNEDDEDEDGLLSTAKLDSNGLLCDIQVLQWKVTDVEVNGSARSDSRMDQDHAFSSSRAEQEELHTGEPSQQEAESDEPPGRSPERQRVQLEKNVRKFSAQIDRQYNGIVSGLDERARAVWDKLYSLFKAKMSADLTDEDQSEIERFVFDSLPTESTDLIWKVYKVLHLEQERDRCQRLILELSQTS